MNNVNISNEKIYKITKNKKIFFYYIITIIKFFLLLCIVFILQPILYLSIILAIPYLFLMEGSDKIVNSFKKLLILGILREKYKEYFN